jgi:ribosomal protein S18 acetylase RimI-like enzyme
MRFLRRIPAELREIARLQRAILPDAIPSLLGFRYTCAFYRFALGSPDEAVVIGRNDGKVVALAVATFAPKTLMRRLVLNTPLLLGVVAGLLRFKLWTAMFDLIFGHAPTSLPLDPSGGGESDAVPELLILCTAPVARGQGHAGRLLDQIEALMRARGVRRYTVRTFDDDNSSAFRFYAGKGFTAYGRQDGIFSSFRLMEKRLIVPARVGDPVISNRA